MNEADKVNIFIAFWISERHYPARQNSILMEPKFILTLDGHLRIGSVQMHKDLLLPNDTCIGGGFWEVDPISMKLLLSGKSYDYGKPKFNFVTGKLYVPKDYEGLRIEYNSDSLVDSLNVSEQFEISYFWCLEEISLVSSKFL